MFDKEGLFSGLEKILDNILPTDPRDRTRAINYIDSEFFKISSSFQNLLTKLGTGVTTKEILEAVYELGIPEDLQEAPKETGKWMSVVDIKEAGSSYSNVTITKKLSEHKDKLQTKKDGKKWFGYITEENYSILKLPDNLFGEKDVIININSRDDTFSPDHNYTKEEVTKILLWVNHGVFHNENIIDNVIHKIGKNNIILGTSLIDFVNEVKDMMFLGSETTQLTIQNSCKRPYAEIVNFWNTNEFTDYVHLIPNIFPGTFIKKEDLPEICEKIKNQAYDSEVSEALNKAHQKLILKRAMPRGRAYSTLVEFKILNNDSVETINETYPKFEEAMNGFSFFNCDNLRREMNIEWDKFREHMDRLEKLDLVKNILSLYEVNNQKSFYVIATGKKDEVYDALGID